MPVTTNTETAENQGTTDTEMEFEVDLNLGETDELTNIDMTRLEDELYDTTKDAIDGDTASGEGPDPGNDKGEDLPGGDEEHKDTTG